MIQKGSCRQPVHSHLQVLKAFAVCHSLATLLAGFRTLFDSALLKDKSFKFIRSYIKYLSRIICIFNWDLQRWVKKSRNIRWSSRACIRSRGTATPSSGSGNFRNRRSTTRRWPDPERGGSGRGWAGQTTRSGSCERRGNPLRSLPSRMRKSLPHGPWRRKVRRIPDRRSRWRPWKRRVRECSSPPRCQRATR